ncbi:MAG: magnesium transporter, partial [Clostridiales bacterium]|nr:magnesium transporter [Clostridiales bacterium]
VGIVTVDDIVQVIEEENTEDIERMAALSPSEEPYLKTTVARVAKNRIPWLLVLMLSATITGTIISHFEASIAAMTALVAFIPMLMGTGGNAGSQASTTIIRGMALGEIQIKDIIKVVWREVRVGVMCGAALGLVNFARIYIMSSPKDTTALLTSLTVTLSLIMTVILAKTVGCILPIAAKRLRIDPAIMAAPLITTIVDATSLIVYFTIAKTIMQI